jgi:DnaK suppressor protein
MGEKNRYTDTELQEFKELIHEKLKKAQSDYEMYKNSIHYGRWQ